MSYGRLKLGYQSYQNLDFCGRMRARGARMHMQLQNCVRKPLSRGPKIHVLGPKASLFDGARPLDPLECPKP